MSPTKVDDGVSAIEDDGVIRMLVGVDVEVGVLQSFTVMFLPPPILV